MRFIFVPLANIAVTICALPHAVAMLDAVNPFTIISVTVLPCVEPFTTDTAILIVAQVLVSITEALISLTMALIIEPFTLENAADIIHTDAGALAHSIKQLAAIERLFVTLYCKGVAFL